MSEVTIPADAATRTTRPAPLGAVAGTEMIALIALLLLASQLDQLTTYSSVTSYVFAYSIIGSSLVLLFGVAGQLSLGHAIFVGIGAFTGARISASTGYGLELEVPVAVAVGLALGLLVGLPSLRVRDFYLALATFALAFVGQQALFSFKWLTHGSQGLASGPLRLFGVELSTNLSLLYAGLGMMALCWFFVLNMTRARTGRAWRAIRTSETSAASVGLPVAWLKVLSFGLSGAFASVGGVLLAHTTGYVTPENFGLDFSILVLLAVIIGGSHRLAGAFAGALFVIALPELFRSIVDWQGIVYGSILLLLILFYPTGLVGLAEGVASRGRTVLGPLVGPLALADFRSSKPLRALLGEVRAPDSGSDFFRAPAGPRGHVRIEAMSVRFGGLTAVQSVSIEVAAGTVVGLIGANGAGKTTLFNAVTGFTPATGGLWLDEQRLDQLSIRHRALAGMARTFQNLNLHADLSVIDHVLLGLDRTIRYGFMAESVRAPWVVAREREAHATALDLLDRLGLGHVAGRKAGDLPYGLQKRVDVARALATSPRLLLLDEPAAGLPTAEALEVIASVRAAAIHLGATVIIIEHNVELVAQACSRIIAMNAGQVIADDTPDTVLRDPAVIAAYLGT